VAEKLKPRVLVLGGTGFIGVHLIPRLLKEYRVDCVHKLLLRKSYRIKKVTYIRLNLEDFNQVKKKINKDYKFIFNLGGYIDHSSSYEVNNINLKTHFMSVVNLVSIFSKKKITRFINIGSSDEYGSSEIIQNEKYREAPQSFYALSKVCSTHFLQMAYKNIKFPSVIIRIFIAYGPKQKKNRLIPYIIDTCLRNKTAYLNRGDQVRNFCYIEDVVEAIMLFTKPKIKNVDGMIFNVGCNKSYKVKDIAYKIKKIISRGNLIFNKKIDKRESKLLIPNINRIKKIYNWKPNFSIDLGLKKTIEYYQKVK
jgi:nucleoside-diphosphate-sugar epimerase